MSASLVGSEMCIRDSFGLLGYLGVLVGIVLQQVFATEHPLVPLLRVGGESHP